VINEENMRQTRKVVILFDLAPTLNVKNSDILISGDKIQCGDKKAFVTNGSVTVCCKKKQFFENDGHHTDGHC
jgi:hypothetical protein